MGEVSQPPPSPRLQTLVDAVTAYCAEPRTTDARQAGADLIVLRHAMDRLDYDFSRLAQVFADSEVYADDDGSSSPIVWMRNHCKMGSGAAADRISIGELTEPLAECTRALEGGEIGFPHLTLIARTVERILINKGDCEVDVHRLLDLAREQDLSRFRKSCDHYRHSEDPLGFARDEAAVHDARYLEVRPSDDGGFSVRGSLDAVGGATVVVALESLSRRQGQDDDRRVGQRTADALVDLAERVLNEGSLPQRGGQKPHLVTTSLETLLSMPGASAADVELGLPISAKAVERIACDCSVTRVLLGSDSAVIDLGREKRVISPALRRALNVRDGGCIWPGCGRPVSTCDGHHFEHWLHGGKTNPGNTALLCGAHDYRVHEGGWQILVTDDRRVVTIPP